MAAADYRLMTEATGQRIAIALENLAGFGDYLTTANVVNNLTSTATDKPGSANMLRVLNEAITQSTATTYVAATPVSNTFSTVVINAYRVGNIVVVSYYLVTSKALARLDTMVDFSIPNNFIANFFNGEKVNLAIRTKSMIADAAISSGETLSGFIVGLME